MSHVALLDLLRLRMAESEAADRRVELMRLSAVTGHLPEFIANEYERVKRDSEQAEHDRQKAWDSFRAALSGEICEDPATGSSEFSDGSDFGSGGEPEVSGTL